MHIDKTFFQAPASYVTELRLAHLDKANILFYHPGKTGRELFGLVKRLPSYVTMRQKLLEDQGYVCCYCNRRIPIPGHIVVTEHVKPVSLHLDLAGEYQNLLLTCDGGELIPPILIGVTPPYTRNTYPLHCDKAKANQELPVSPFDADCENRFYYNPITGSIDGVAGDSDAADTVTILNLNQRFLKKERKEEIKNRCYDSSGLLLTPAQLFVVFSQMLTKNVAGQYHNLYFVVANAVLNLV